MKLTLLAVGLVACSYTAPSSAASPGVSVGGLVQSQYQACNQGGENLAKYLETGEPKSNDPAYGNERQQVLALQGEQRSLAIRQFADQYIERCAEQEAKAEADAARAKAEAEKQAAEEAQRQKYEQNASANCAKVGGKWGSLRCSIAYRSNGDGQLYYYTVSFDRDGNITAGNLLPENKSAEACAAWGREVFHDSTTVTYHADTMICAI